MSRGANWQPSGAEANILLASDAALKRRSSTKTSSTKTSSRKISSTKDLLHQGALSTKTFPAADDAVVSTC
jgi:hypothetical protein